MSRTLADRSRPPETERGTDRMRTTPVRIAPHSVKDKRDGSYVC